MSVVLPVYNGEKYLRRTLGHLAGIKRRDMEILLIDDGSADQSADICQTQAAGDPRFRYVRQEHMGIAAARNKGVSLARGKYIGFCDQDDVLLTRGYFSLLLKMKSCNAQMGICSTERLIGGMRSPYERLTNGVYRGNEVQKELLYPLLFRGYAYPFVRSKNYLYGTLWKCIFRMDFIRENHLTFAAFVGYEDDWLFVTRALCIARNAVSVSASGYCWRVGQDSASHRHTETGDLLERSARLDAYLYSYLEAGIGDAAVFREFQKINTCEHYMAVLRERYDKSVLQEYLQETDYRKQLSCRKYLVRSAIQKRVLLNLLWCGGVRTAYVVSRVYDWLVTKLEKVQWIILLERRSKIS